MNLDNIEAIVELLGTLGNETKEGFIWYLGLGFATELLSYGVGIIAIITGYKLIIKIISAVTDSTCNTEALKEIRNILNVGYPGRLTKTEKTTIIRIVSELKAKKEN